MNRSIPLALLAAAMATGLPPSEGRAAEPIKVDVGQIAGAQFAIANPVVPWNHDVLIIAHGYRPDTAPLIPDLHPDAASNRALLNEGWIVATTSYRRNGIVVADAIADIDALRAYIVAAHGEPQRVILSGDSLGGLIVTIMSERDPGPYQGAVAFDPTLYIKETNSSAGLTLLPRIPLLFVTTTQETAQAKSYVLAVARPPPVVQPVLFLISREGHTNINQAEHLASIRALNAWIAGGPEALPPPQENHAFFDATFEPDPGPSLADPHADGQGFDTRVAEVDKVYGNVLLQAQAPDFASAGVAGMTYFTLTAGGKAYRVLYGHTYSDARTGEWVAFPDADGRTVLAVSSGNAAAVSGIKAGDILSVATLPPHPAASP